MPGQALGLVLTRPSDLSDLHTIPGEAGAQGEVEKQLSFIQPGEAGLWGTGAPSQTRAPVLGSVQIPTGEGGPLLGLLVGCLPPNRHSWEIIPSSSSSYLLGLGPPLHSPAWLWFQVQVDSGPVGHVTHPEGRHLEVSVPASREGLGGFWESLDTPNNTGGTFPASEVRDLCSCWFPPPPPPFSLTPRTHIFSLLSEAGCILEASSGPQTHGLIYILFTSLVS